MSVGHRTYILKLYSNIVISGEGNDNPLQYSCLENSMDRGAWQAIVHGVTESHMAEWLSIVIRLFIQLYHKHNNSSQNSKQILCLVDSLNNLQVYIDYFIS